MENTIPQVVLCAVIKAKQIANKKEIPWYRTIEGKCGLSFLLGFYDADGSLRYEKYATIYNSNKRILDEIKVILKINNRVYLDKIPIRSKITESFTLTNYALNISLKMFKHMLNAFPLSMERKRHIDYRNSEFKNKS
ncbi:MAG: LAGLIDADG family homing endonuclease [Promethearchaeota archaeon]